jgi:hypothetical protein
MIFNIIKSNSITAQEYDCEGINCANKKSLLRDGKLSNGHSRQICENRELLVQIWRGESHFSQKWPLANVGESGKYSVNGLVNVGESAQHGSANGGESGESAQHGLANVGESGKYSPSLRQMLAQAGMIKIGCF